MICKEEVFVWFKNLCCTKRIEMMHGLLNMCVPLELRFFGTCIEDLCKKDFLYFRDTELKANSAAAAAEITTKLNDLSDHVNRTRLVAFLALLHSSNRTSANAIFNVLLAENSLSKEMQMIGGGGNKAMAATVVDDCRSFADEMLLLLTLAYYHPAFTFEQKDTILSRVTYYQFAVEETSRAQDCSHDVGHCRSSDFCDGDGIVDAFATSNSQSFVPETGCAIPLPNAFPAPSGSDSNLTRGTSVLDLEEVLEEEEEELVESAGQTVVATAAVGTALPPSRQSDNAAGVPSGSDGVTFSSCAAKPSSTTDAQLPRGNSSTRTAAGLPNSSLFKAHIKHLELKSMQRKKKVDKRMDYRIQVTWANGEVTDVTKSHQELCNFHQQLVHFLPDDANVHRQERLIPYFTGPKQLVGNRTDELTDDSINRMADYLRQLMVKVPNHILDSDLVTSFFRACDNSSEGGAHVSTVTGTSTTSSSSALPLPLPPPHILSQIQQQTSHFSSSSSLSSASSSVSLPSSPPPPGPLTPHCSDGANNLLTVNTVNFSHGQNDLSLPSQQLKSLTIYNSLRPDGASSSFQQQQRASVPSQQASFSTTTATTTTINTGNVGMRHSQQRRHSPKPLSFSQPSSLHTNACEVDEFVMELFHKEKLKRIFEHLRKKYSLKEMIDLTENDLKYEGIAVSKAKRIMKIFEVLKCQQPPNGLTGRQLLDVPPLKITATTTSNHYQQSNVVAGAVAPPPVLPQSQVVLQSAPPCCTVHTCQTQVYMPTVPVDLLVRYSAPVVASESSKTTLQSVPAPAVPLSVPSATGALCNGEIGGNREPVDLVSFVESINDTAATDKANDVTNDTKLRRSGRSGSGSGTSALKMPSKGKAVVEGVVRKLSNVSLPTTVVARPNVEEDVSCDREVRTSSPMMVEVGGTHSYPPPCTGRGGGAMIRISTSDEANQSCCSLPTNNQPRKAAIYPPIHQKPPPSQAPLSLAQLNVHQQRVSNRGQSAAVPGHPVNLCQTTCSNTRDSATPPPVPPPPTLSYSFVPLPLGGVFSPFPGSAAPAFLSPHSNGFVPTPTIPPPNYQFLHSPDGLIQADYATYSQITSMLQQQSAGMSNVQQRLPPPPTVPGFVAGPSPNVGFHGNQLQSPPPSVIPPGGNAMHNHVSLVGFGPPPNVNIRAKLSCYNCGQSGHQGSECSDASLDEITKAGQFQLSFLPAVKQLDDCD